MKYTKHYSTKRTPQAQKIPGRENDQAQNNAGGVSFVLDKWKMLDRFLILGSEGGTFYVGEQKLTIENASNAVKCIAEDGIRVVDRVVEISTEGRAPKNDPALFVLALCSCEDFANMETRNHAFDQLSKVARIGTHLFHYVDFCTDLRGWGRGLKKAVSNWYLEKDIDRLAFQITKYQKRDGWSHKDVISLAHPKPETVLQNEIFQYITTEGERKPRNEFINAVDIVKHPNIDEKNTLELVEKYNLPMEVVPTDKRTPKMYERVLHNGAGLTWIMRNLGNLTRHGIISNGKWDNVEFVRNRLEDENQLAKARLHPLQILVALRTYASGGGMRGKNTWIPNPDIIEALDNSFYKAFKFVEPTGKRYLLGIDVSGSMTFETIAGLPITPAEAAAAQAMVTYKTEERVVPMAFAGDFRRLGMSRNQRLDDVLNDTYAMSFGNTDCALPMLYAKQENIDVDVFVVLTDNETWYGDVHPIQALQDYRRTSGIEDAKLVVVGMTGTRYSIADPRDPSTLDVVGFDTATPQIISQFAIGDI